MKRGCHSGTARPSKRALSLSCSASIQFQSLFSTPFHSFPLFSNISKMPSFAPLVIVLAALSQVQALPALDLVGNVKANVGNLADVNVQAKVRSLRTLNETTDFVKLG
jgi:hypothetical protein